MNEPLVEESEGELPSEVIRLLLDGVAPERTSEFEAFFLQHEPRFMISAKAREYGGFCALEDRNQVLLAPNARVALWFLSFAAWHAFRARAPQEVLAAALPAGPMRDEILLSEDQDYLPEVTASRDITHLALQLIRRPVRADAVWPEAVPYPEVVLEAQERGDATLPVEHAAIKDLALFAIAYILLHELRHIAFNSARNGIPPIQEELACDAFAIEQILGQAASWRPSDGSTAEPDKVIFKRSMGLLIGFFVLHAVTPEGHRGPQATYPSLRERLKAIVNAIALHENHQLWLFGSCLLRELQSDSEYVVLSLDSTKTLKSNFIEQAERGFR